jgi:hypothetical protein
MKNIGNIFILFILCFFIVVELVVIGAELSKSRKTARGPVIDIQATIVK